MALKLKGLLQRNSLTPSSSSSSAKKCSAIDSNKRQHVKVKNKREKKGRHNLNFSNAPQSSNFSNSPDALFTIRKQSFSLGKSKIKKANRQRRITDGKREDSSLAVENISNPNFPVNVDTSQRQVEQSMDSAVMEDGENFKVEDILQKDVSLDPYQLKESLVCSEALKDSRWVNKQRTLVFSSRGISQRQRHFLEDLKRLMPHYKSEPKWEKKSQLIEINEICESHSCNNCVFLETRRNTELYMWISRTPMGPSARFQVLNVHTLGELRMTGNCLLYSRPLLIFDKGFSYYPHLQLLKEMFVQTFGTPRNHPKSKPFFDHVFSFFHFDNKIWFRHYQISPMTERDFNNPLKQCLTEIGPRFVLDIQKIFEDSFSGRIIYRNPHYLSPTKMRSLSMCSLSSKYAARKAKEYEKKIRQAGMVTSQDFLDRSQIFTLNKK